MQEHTIDGDIVTLKIKQVDGTRLGIEIPLAIWEKFKLARFGVSQRQNGKYTVRVTLNGHQQYLSELTTKVINYGNLGLHNFTINGEVVTIHIAQKNGNKQDILIDLDEWDRLKDYPIWVVEDFEGFRAKIKDAAGFHYYIHRVVMDAQDGEYIDHIYHKTLDCRKSELRKVSNSENLLNRKGAQKNNLSSGERGVHFDSRRCNWRARCTIEGIEYRAGVYTTKEEATAAIKLFRANFVPTSKEARDVVIAGDTATVTFA